MPGRPQVGLWDPSDVAVAVADSAKPLPAVAEPGVEFSWLPRSQVLDRAAAGRRCGSHPPVAAHER